MDEDWKAKGNAAFAARQFREAVEFFSNGIRSNPTDHILYSNRSGAYASMGNYDAALEDACKCVTLKPDWSKGYSRRGFAQLQLGDVKGAIASYEKGLNIDPTNKALLDGLREAQSRDPDVLLKSRVNMMTDILMHTPKYKKYCEEDPDFETRLKALLKEILADPKMLQLTLGVCPDPRLKEAVTEILGIKKEVDPEEEAERRRAESAKKAEEERRKKAAAEAKKSEETPEALAALEWRQKGNELYKQRQFTSALEMYDRAIQQNPKDISLLNNKAAVYLEMGNIDESIAMCQKALDMRYEVMAPYEKVAKVYNRLASCYQKKGDYATAIEMLEKSLMEDNVRQTRVLLADLRREKEKRDADAYLDPELAEQHRTQGNEYFKKADFPNAKKEYDEGIRRNPKEPKLYANRAATLMKLLDLPGALKDVEKSLDLDGTVPKVWARKGNILLLMKEYNKAIGAFQSGLKIDPNNEDCMNGLATTSRRIQESTMSDTVDEEQVRRSMADPEIQGVLSDPQFNLILREIQEDPMKLMQHLKNPNVAAGLQKLMAAGILKMT